ncbi:hypothetical protein BCEP4_220005 [Burkholderia cepacia]|nr:hypothetical protein BCEP4_220005 [Burkholderia cepacia]
MWHSHALFRHFGNPKPGAEDTVANRGGCAALHVASPPSP